MASVDVYEVKTSRKSEMLFRIFLRWPFPEDVKGFILHNEK